MLSSLVQTESSVHAVHGLTLLCQGITSAQSGRHDEDLDDIGVCHPPLSLMLA